jgi:hypothetical protein
VSARLQVTSSGLQQLLELPALADLEVAEYVKVDESSDDEHRSPQHNVDHDPLPAALYDLCASVRLAGRDLVIKNIDEIVS